MGDFATNFDLVFSQFTITQTNYWFGLIIPGQHSIFENRNDWNLPSSSKGIKRWIRRTGLQSTVLDRKWSFSQWSWSMSLSQEKRKGHHQIQKQKSKLYVIIMSRTSFTVNSQSIVCLNFKELLARSRRHIWS